MINAAEFPGPALWQGLMLLLILPTIPAMIKWPDRMGWIIGSYSAVGVVLMIAILSARP